jgi:hypothetical protein
VIRLAGLLTACSLGPDTGRGSGFRVLNLNLGLDTDALSYTKQQHAIWGVGFNPSWPFMTAVQTWSILCKL